MTSFGPVQLVFRSGGIGLAFLLSFSGTANSAPKLRARVGAAHAVVAPQQQEFGWGGLAGLGVELPVSPTVAIAAQVDGLLLSKGADPPAPFSSAGSGNLVSGRLGLRLTPLSFRASAMQHSVFLDLGGGYGRTGDNSRAVASCDLAYDVASEGTSLGPFFGYRHLFQPNDRLRPEDAHLFVVGLQGSVTAGSEPATDDDWDKDGIVNAVDRCPREPEDKDGFQDDDGCPDPDNDRDGIPDLSDRCPNAPEDKDGFEDDDGCPDVDNDRDGVLDAVDNCPNEAEDIDDFDDDDGCPDLDNDKDGIPDAKDQCPNEPETVNQYADDDGCPDEVSVRVVGDHIVLDEIIYFAYNDSRIRRDSEALVGRIATLLKDHPEYLAISIEGHTDELGRADYNQGLSEARAMSVRQKLIDFGVEAERLTAVGFGESRPIVRVRGSHQKNRRVEFIITQKRARTGSTIRRGSSTTPVTDHAHAQLRSVSGRSL